MRRDILKFTEDSRSEGISSDAYGVNGSFHITDLEQEFQKRLVVRNKSESIYFSNFGYYIPVLISFDNIFRRLYHFRPFWNL